MTEPDAKSVIVAPNCTSEQFLHNSSCLCSVLHQCRYIIIDIIIIACIAHRPLEDDFVPIDRRTVSEQIWWTQVTRG